MSTEGGSSVEIETAPSIFEEFSSEIGNSHIRNNNSTASDAEGYVGVNKNQAKTTQEKAKESADYRQQILDAKCQEDGRSESARSNQSEMSNVSNVSQIGNRKKNRKKKKSIYSQKDDDDSDFDDDFCVRQIQCNDVESVEEEVEKKTPEGGCCVIM
jgi:hypothetical protein